MEDLAARRRGRGLGDARRPDGGRVGEGLVSIEPTDEDGVVRSHRIDPLPTWQRLPTPQGVIPVSALDPLPRLPRLGERRDPPHEFLRRRGIAQVEGRKLEAALHEMGVPVGEARQDQSSAGIDDGGA